MKARNELIRTKCKQKVDYKTSYLAWQDAFYLSIKYNRLMIPYKCNLTKPEHYHLSSHHTVGDGSHIPPEYRDMMLVIGNEQESNPSFWHRLRHFLNC